MNEKFRVSNWRRWVGDNWARFKVILLGLFIYSCFGSMVVSWLTRLESGYWLFALLVSSALMIGVVITIFWIEKTPLNPLNYGPYPRTTLILFLILLTLLGIWALAFLSNILHNLGWLQIQTEQPIDTGLFLNYYFWHFIDDIPILGVWSVVDVQAPAEAEGWPANLLLKLFLVFIVAAAIKLYKSKNVDIKAQREFARFKLAQGESDNARRAIQEILPSVKKSRSYSEQIDVYLEYAEILIALGDAKEANQYLDKAGKTIGKARRDSDLDSRQQMLQVLQGKTHNTDMV